MPLPDATPDKRIYELLKTVDLENLTFADLQAVGQTIYAEQGAEDELRRLVLLNLARLSVIGEWTGLTSAGGGGGGWTTTGTELYSDYDEFCTLFPFVGRTTSITNQGVTQNQGYCYPFIARKTGTVTQMTIDCNSALAGLTNQNVGIYTDGPGYPKDIIGNGIFDCTSTGIKSVTSFTDESGNPATIDLTADTVYWVVWGTTDAVVQTTGILGGSSTQNASVGYLPERSNNAFANRALVCRHISGGLATWSGVQASYVATNWQPYNATTYGVPIGVYLEY